MASVPVTNNFGEVSFGSAVPVEVPDYTKDILAGMRQKQAEEDEAIRDSIKQRREREEKLSKKKEDLNKFLFTNRPAVLPIREEELKSHVANLVGYLADKSKDKSWDPDSDKKYSELYQGVQSIYNNRGEEYKNYLKSAAIPLDDKNQGKYDVNHDYFQAAMGKDPEKAARALARFNNNGDESNWEQYDAAGYLGVGALKAKDVTPWDTNTIKYVNSLKLPQKGSDIGGGKIRTTEGLSSEEIQKAADDFMLGEGGKNAESLTTQQKANQPTFSMDEGERVVRNMFVDKLTQRNKDNLKGGSSGSYGDKQKSKLFFSEYNSKGKEGGAAGFNVGFIGSNKGLKADLQYGNDELKDVDLKTIYKTPDGNLKGIVMQYDYEERPMNEDEKKKEKSSAVMQMRDPVYVKTTRIEKPKTIDFNVGSNNYNTIVSQYPGVEEKINELQSKKTSAVKTEIKKVSLQKGVKKEFKEGMATFDGTKWVLDK